MSEQKDKNKYKIFKYILFYDVIFIIIGLIISKIIDNSGYTLLRRTEIPLVTVFIFSCCIGLWQLIYELYKENVKKKKNFKVLMITCTVITMLICSFYLVIEYGVVKDYNEYITTNENGEKEIEVVKHNWLDPDEMTHYKYINKFIREKTPIYNENLIIEDDIIINTPDNENEEEEENSNKVEVNPSNFLLKVEYADETIGIEYLGNALGQKTIVRVASTKDNGKTWTFKNETLTINNGAKFTQINGRIYINNLGIISYGGQNSRLLISDDRGENFNEADIEIPDDIFVQEIEDVPYLNNGVYEFKTIDYDGNILTYNSIDGIEWKLVR